MRVAIVAKLRVPLFRGDKSDIQTDWRSALNVNMFYVPNEILQSDGYLRSSYGLQAYGTASGIDRAGFFNNRQNNHFRVSGNDLISVDPNGSTSILGDIPQIEQCAMTYSFQNQVVTNRTSSFLYNKDDGFRQIINDNLGQVFDTVFLNNRLIHTDGSTLIVSDPGNDEGYDPNAFGGGESQPDGILGVGVLYNKLIAFGKSTIEWYFDAGLEDFPFERIESQLISVGIVSTHAKTKFPDNNGNPSYAFIGSGENEPLAVRVTGQASAPKISTREIDQILLEYAEDELSDIRLEQRKLENNNLLICHLPRHTLQYDRAASIAGQYPMWTIQKTDVISDAPARYINGVYDTRISSWIYGDRIDGRLGRLDKSVCTQYGETVEELFFTPMIQITQGSVNGMSFENLPGRTDQLADPKIFLSSTRNGLTYGKETLFRMGKLGEYGKKFRVRQLGYTDNYIGYKYRKTNKTPMAVSKLMLEVG